MENNKKPRRRVREIMVKGVKALLEKLEKKEEGIIIGKEKIMSILPHRGDKLLLDKVIITADKIIGEFKVTKEVCKGHEFDGKLVFRGVDTIEMAAQLLGIWAGQYSEFKGKIPYLRDIRGEVKFIAPVFPSDLLVMELPVKKEIGSEEEESPRVEVSGRPGRLTQRIIGEKFVATVNGQHKVIISSIGLASGVKGLAE